jgi:hypothetical protein
MYRFKSAWDAQWSLSAHDQVVNLFRIAYPEPAIASGRRALPASRVLRFRARSPIQPPPSRALTPGGSKGCRTSLLSSLRAVIPVELTPNSLR